MRRTVWQIPHHWTEDGSAELWKAREGRYQEPLRVAKGDVVNLLGGGLEIAW